MRAGDLQVEARQLVEIARALSYGARFIILDEPTAQLDGEEIKRLFVRMRELQAQGVTFLFISHHLQEVYEICQAVTVLRDARHIVSAPVAELPQGPADRGDDRRAGALRLRRCRRPRPLPADAPVALEVDAPRRRGFPRRQLHRAPRRGRRHLRRDQQRPDRRRRGDRRARRASRPARSAINGRALPPGDVPAALALGRRLRAEEPARRRAWCCRSRSPTTPR